MDGDADMTLTTTILGRPVTCTVTPLDDGIHVLLAGGDKGHIGAVSVCDPSADPETMTLPGHKEQYLTAPWAKAIADAAGQRCCTVCGIHYDNATPQQISAVMEGCDGLLSQLLAQLPDRFK